MKDAFSSLPPGLAARLRESDLSKRREVRIVGRTLAALGLPLAAYVTWHEWRYGGFALAGSDTWAAIAGGAGAGVLGLGLTWLARRLGLWRAFVTDELATVTAVRVRTQTRKGRASSALVFELPSGRERVLPLGWGADEARNEAALREARQMLKAHGGADGEPPQLEGPD